MSDWTINPPFAAIIKSTLYNLQYINFREKINKGMLCWVYAVKSAEVGGGAECASALQKKLELRIQKL
jgi:hypothetical protein